MQEKYYYKAVIGILEISVDNNALISLKLTDKIGKDLPKTKFVAEIIEQLDEYFSGKRKKFEIRINPSGTEFQKTVWAELQKIPYGTSKSYSEIAKILGNKNCSRAVGNACNKNPILIVIPCHRVISKTGKLSGFAYGTKIKEKLLKLEDNSK